jgi:hypothetical protein
MSPFDNPALMAVMYATLEGYRLNWPTGADRLLVVSVGTGRADKEVKRSKIASEHALKALLGLMDDCAALQEILLQWMSTSRTARTIDREIGDLQHDLIAPAPLISYLRYNGNLAVDAVRTLVPEIDGKKIESLTEMDAPENMQILDEIGKRTAERDVHSLDFPSIADLTLITDPAKTPLISQRYLDANSAATRFELEANRRNLDILKALNLFEPGVSAALAVIESETASALRRRKHRNGHCFSRATW